MLNLMHTENNLTKRHLYKRTIKTIEGKPIKAWYYWYYDPITHKQVRKTCGTDKAPCFTRHEAVAFIASLAEKEQTYMDIKAEVESVTIAIMAHTMYAQGSIYLKLQKELGKAVSDLTLKEIKRFLRLWILPWYGNLKIEELDPTQIQNDLLAIDRSNSWRNRIIYIVDCILGEAVRNKMIKYKPQIPKFKTVVNRKKDILSVDDIKTLFPDDFTALAKIWDKKGQETDTGFMFGCFYALMLSTGLRLGEARAINPIQLIIAQGKSIYPMVEYYTENALIIDNAVYGIIIDRMFSREQVVRHLKKGTAADPKWRSALLPDKTVRYLRHWLMIRPKLVPELLFTFRGRKITQLYAEQRLRIGFKNTNISIENRIITPHSLRFTYNTRMRRLIPGEFLRLMIGHTTEGMSDYYTRVEVEEDFLSLLSHRGNINRFWENN
jgi:integrase